jgi:hypothetical protein
LVLEITVAVLGVSFGAGCRGGDGEGLGGGDGEGLNLGEGEALGSGEGEGLREGEGLGAGMQPVKAAANTMSWLKS